MISGYATPSIPGAYKGKNRRINPSRLWCPRSLVRIERDKPYYFEGSNCGELATKAFWSWGSPK